MKNKKTIISIIFFILIFIGIGSFFCLSKNSKIFYNDEKVKIEEIKKSIVHIIPEKKLIEYDNNPEGVFGEEYNSGIGAGFFISKDGKIITASHVINNLKFKYFVITFDNKKYEADIISRDKRTDIAILKINSNDTYNPLKISKNFNSINIGDKIISFGTNPKTLEINYVKGKITNKNIKLENISNLIEFSPQIMLGFSGGPLINNHGEAIGINYSIFNNKSYAISNIIF